MIDPLMRGENYGNGEIVIREEEEEYNRLATKSIHT